MRKKYAGMMVHQCEEIKYSINDISKIDFEEQVIDLKDYLKDFSLKIDNGSSYGWIDHTYKDLETSCLKRNYMGHGDAACGTQDSFKANLQNRNPSYDPPFMKVYQDPTKICYSPNLKPEWHRKLDSFTLDITELKKSFLKSPSGADSPVMTFYIHMEGQFIRSIGKEHLSLNKFDLESHCPNFPEKRKTSIGSKGTGGSVSVSAGRRSGIASFSSRQRSSELDAEEKGDCFGLTVNLDISQVTLLKNRPDANIACNPKLRDEDFKIVETIVNDTRVNCVPIFWLKIQNYSSTYPTCSKESQYDRIRELLVNFTLVSDIVRSKFDPPCEELIIESSNQRIKGRKVEPKFKSMKNGYGDVIMVNGHTAYHRQYLDVKIRQVNNRYQMITNNKEFTIESCLSGIGGFIGILIGLSLRQIPEILCLFLNFACKTSRNNNVGAF